MPLIADSVYAEMLTNTTRSPNRCSEMELLRYRLEDDVRTDVPRSAVPLINIQTIFVNFVVVITIN